MTKLNFSTVSYVGLRGSVYRGYCQFPFSDIDVTITLTDTKEIVSIRRYLQKIIKSIPFFCEFNLYLEPKLEGFISIFNGAESLRDPFLWTFQCEVDNSEEALLVFMLKLLQANRGRGVKYNRSVKWQYYSSLCRFEDVYSRDEFKRRVELKLFESCGEEFNLEKSNSSPEVFISLGEWLEHCFKNHCFDEKRSQLVNLSESKKMLVLKQVEWEVMGLLSQIYLVDGQLSYREHLKNLKLVLDGLRLEDLDLSTVYNKINELSDLESLFYPI
ncbi:hypothetical protein [Bacteriovorax sp. Seq25_V]|uniref:hypothetical protein n=1 Tax=Bacteriovorax sp. Seq25_V TaxID=1201288 RepID=UPI0012F91629|nr:hypothetical protein [Bacteriovorax sp. Seq25_V]